MWQVAIAHDFRLPQDDPPVHLYPPTTLRVDGLGWLRAFRDDGGAVTWDLPVGHSGNDGLIAWGRWGHGRTGGDGRHGGIDITGGEGVRNAIYYVAGAPLAEAPAGAARYSVLGGQVSPTAGEGGMAATTFLENGVLQVDSAAGRATLKLAITVPSGRYELVGAGPAHRRGPFRDRAGQSPDASRACCALPAARRTWKASWPGRPASGRALRTTSTSRR